MALSERNRRKNAPSSSSCTREAWAAAIVSILVSFESWELVEINRGVKLRVYDRSWLHSDAKKGRLWDLMISFFSEHRFFELCSIILVFSNCVSSILLSAATALLLSVSLAFWLAATAFHPSSFNFKFARPFSFATVRAFISVILHSWAST